MDSTNLCVYLKIIDSAIQLKTKELLENINKLGLKIITIESMTGGAIINTLTNVSGYSNNIYGGLIVYHNNAKEELLGKIAISVYSLDYAKKMCLDALMKYSANIAISITGNTDPTNPANGDYSSIFYVGIGFKNNNNIDDMDLKTKKIILNNNILENYKENSIDRREFIKKIAVKKVLSFANKSINEKRH